MNNMMMNSYFGFMNSAAAAALSQPSTLSQQPQDAQIPQYSGHANNSWNLNSSRLGLLPTQHHNSSIIDNYGETGLYLKDPSISSVSSSSSSFTSLSPTSNEQQQHRNYQYNHDTYYGFAPVPQNSSYLLDSNLKYITSSSSFTAPTSTATTSSSSSFLSTQSSKSPTSTKNKQHQPQQNQHQHSYDLMHMVAAATVHHNPYQNYFNTHTHIDMSAAVAANELYTAYLSTTGHQQQQQPQTPSSLIPSYNQSNGVASRLLTPTLSQSLKSDSIDLLYHSHQPSFEIVQNSHAASGNCSTPSQSNKNSPGKVSTAPLSTSSTHESSQIYPWMRRLHNGHESGKLTFFDAFLVSK
jgi:hypothetical protein